MHQLILLRHAKAVPEGAAPDHDRILTPAGRAAAAAMGRTMKQAGLAPDVVLVSTAVRTCATLEQLEAANVWDEWPNIDTLQALYMASHGEIRNILQSLPETVRSAMVIGHNPGLHELSLALAGAGTAACRDERLNAGFPTAALAEFLITTPWRRLGHPGASLQRFLLPQDFE